MKKSGFDYFFQGISLALAPDIRKFVILPLLTNIILVGGALFYLFSHLNEWISKWMSHIPDWLSWLSYLLWPILVITILGTFSYFFSTLANLIAAPFNGILSEKVEQKLCGQLSDDQSLVSTIKDTPRIILREIQKILYFLPRTLGLLLVLLIPAIGQTAGAVLWFVFSAWILAIQYCDYPFDNHKISFKKMRWDLKQNQTKAYGFGICVAFFTTIPILNLIVMPAAVCGATAMWVNEFKAKHD